MGRRVAVEATLEAAKYLAAAKAVEKSTAAMDREMGQLDKAIDKVDRDLVELAAESAAATTAMKGLDAEANKLGKSFDTMGRNIEGVEQSTDGATRSLRTHESQMALMRAEYEKTTRRIAELNAELLNTNTGDKSGLRKTLRDQQRYLAELKRVAAEFTKATGTRFNLGGGDAPVTGVLQGILGGIPNMGGAPPALIAGGAAVGLALAPPIAAAVSGAILGGVGLGGVVGGAFLAAKDARVQSAWKTLGAGLMRELEPVGDSFAGPVARAAEIFRNSFDDAEIVKGLAAASAMVEPLARGLGGFVEAIGPGLEDALQGARPIVSMLSKALPEFGEDLGKALSTIAAVGPAAARGLGQVIDITGELTKQAAAAGAGLTAINDLFPTSAKLLQYIPIGGFAQVVGTAMEQLAPKTDAVGQKMTYAANATRGMGYALDATTNAINALNPGLDLLKDKLNLAQVKEAAAADLLAFREEVNATGTSLSQNTEVGLRHRSMLLGLVSDYEAERQAAIAAGNGSAEATAAANAKFQQQVKDLEALAIKLGISKQAVWDLIGAYHNIPSQVTTAIITDFQTRGVPAGEHSGLRIGEIGRAAGGPVIPGMPYTINERGYESVTFPAPGMVHPANLSPARAWSGGGSGGHVAAVPINITAPGGSYESYVIELINTAVQARGGRLGILGLKG